MMAGQNPYMWLLWFRIIGPVPNGTLHMKFQSFVLISCVR